MEKICAYCKWLRPPEHGVNLTFLPDEDAACMNSLNDGFYNYFNSSTGDVVYGIRTVKVTTVTSTCDLFEAPPKKGNQK